MKKITKLCTLPIFYAFFSTWAILRACGIGTQNPLGAFFFIACLLLYGRFDRWEARRLCSKAETCTSGFIAALFTLFWLLAKYDFLLQGLNSRLFRLGYLVLISLGLFFLLYAAVLSFYLKSKTLQPFREHSAEEAFRQRLPLFSFFFCLLCWLPYLLSNFPGVMTVDSLNQYGQIIGALPESNHHPWLHTQLIGMFYHIGMSLFHDPILALSLFTIFQMLIMAGIFSYSIATLVQMKVRIGICLVILAFYALMPYNGIYMVTMWKDILFSGMVLLFSACLLRFLLSADTASGKAPLFRTTPLTVFFYLLSGFGMCMLRSNGFYAFLLTLPFLLFLFRKQWKQQLLWNFLILAAVLFIKGPIMDARGVAQTDFVESLSIPIQLTARVYADGEAVDTKDEQAWSRIMDTSKIPEVYQDFCSDNMKNLIRQGDQPYLEAHKADYLRLWLSFGAKHPGAYLRGYIDATKGYWYPDVPTPNAIGSDEGIAENPYGLQERPLLRGAAVVKIREILFKLQDMLPIYGLFFSLGAATWLCILLAGKVFLSGRRTCLLLFLPNAGVMATLLIAAPVSNEFRYGYSMLLTLPLLALCAFLLPEAQTEEDLQG